MGKTARLSVLRTLPRVLLPVATLTLLVACAEVGPGLRNDSGRESRGSVTVGAGPEELERLELERVLEGLVFEGGRVRPRHLTAPSAHGGESHLAKGRAALRGGHRMEALAAFVQAVRSNPARPDTYIELGRVLVEEGREEGALAAFRTALDLDPKAVEARFEEGRTLHRLGRIRESLASFRRVFDLDGNHGPAHVRMAVLLHQTGDPEGARRHLDKARRAGARIPAALPVLLGEVDAPPIRVRSLNAPGSSPRDPSVSPARRIDGAPAGVQGAETTIAASPTGEIVAAWIDTREAGEKGEWRIVSAVSLDGGETWTERTVRPSDPHDGQFEGDPMTAYDPRSGSLWVGGAEFPSDVYVARKAPGTDTFPPGVHLRDRSRVSDKPYLAAGPHPDDPRETRLYMTDFRGLQTSDDLGDTWTDLLELEGAPVGALPRIGPDGELYVTALRGDDFILFRSFDGGVTVEDPRVIALRMDTWGFQDGSRFPGRFRVAPIPYCAVDGRDATLYCVYFDTVRAVEGPGGTDFDVDLFFTRSTDRGETWTTPRRIPTGGDGRGDSFFPWLEVDATGRLHMLFYDTRRDPRTDAAGSAAVDVFYAWSEDRGESWTEIRLTEEPFETGDIFWINPEGQFLGDYLGLAVAGPKAHLLYPLSQEGDLDIYFQTVDFTEVPPPRGGPCIPGPRTLCLLDGRFQVQVRWRDPFNGGEGPGRAVPFKFQDGSTSNNTGTFWFFDPANVELVVKALDARTVNGFFWVFYGALSNVEYWVTVTDLQAGTSTRYHNPPGNLCGFGDTMAFPRPGTGAGSEVSTSAAGSDRSILDPLDGPSVDLRRTSAAGGAGCQASDTVLCLQDGRFRIEVEWEDPRSGDTGVGGALPGTKDSGFFWFFDPDNIELVVKLLDARTVNGHFWLFFGGLSDVEYTINVTDTQQDISQIYRNEAFEICGQADTAAF